MPSNINAISRIWVKGYKSLHDMQSIEIRPLTILAGANSSGKSSIMQPLLILKQTLDATSDPGDALLIDGPNISFTLAEQMLSRIPGKISSSDFVLGIQIGDLKLSLTYTKKIQRGFDIRVMEYEEGGKSYAIKYGMDEDAIRELLPEPLKTFIAAPVAKMGWVVTRDRCFLAFGLSAVKDNYKELFPIKTGPVQQFAKSIRDIIHLPASRGNPERTYKKVSRGPYFPGTFETYAASIVAYWKTEEDSRLDMLGSQLEAMGLSWKVIARQVDDTKIELQVGRLAHAKRGSAYDLVNIADVGFGVSQSLPVLVALLCAQPGQLVYLEQPELHLHPKAQRSIARILCRAIKNGSVVVETHSELLIREIQTLVAKGELDKSKVVLHWFTRDQKTGCTKVNSSELDEKGAYGSWPEDFDVIRLAAEKEYLDAVEARNKG